MREGKSPAIYKLTLKGKKKLLNLVKSPILSLLALITSQLLTIKIDTFLGDKSAMTPYILFKISLPSEKK